MKILVYPANHSNPYQHMLYAALETEFEAGLSVRYCRIDERFGSLRLLLRATVSKFTGYQLLHIHWQAFGVTIAGRRSARLGLINAKLSIWYLRRLKLPIVWTVHNVVPHQVETSDDSLVAARLGAAATEVIVHSATAREALREIMGTEPSATVVPHGPYPRGFNANTDRRRARGLLGLPDDRRVFLFLGLIRAYKGIANLLEVWETQILRDFPDALLVIAGRVVDPDLREQIVAARESGTVMFHEGFVDEDRLGDYFGAADFVCLPFEHVDTSGSALLALSYGAPIIAPKLGAISELPDTVGVLYRPGELAGALSRAVEATDQELSTWRDGALRAAQQTGWQEVATRTAAIFRRAIVGRQG